MLRCALIIPYFGSSVVLSTGSDSRVGGNDVGTLLNQDNRTQREQAGDRQPRNRAITG